MNQHQSLTDQHFTPPWIVDAARKVMGGIDIDPCSSKEVNNWSIKATDFYEESGLQYLSSFASSSRVWCNPPGGKTGNQSNMLLWLSALYQHWLEGKIEQFFFLFFNREFIGGTEDIDLSCIPQLHFRQRLKYWSFDPLTKKFQEGNYKQVGKGLYYVAKSTTVNYWHVFDLDGQIVETVADKKEAIAATGGDYLVWTNSPTQQSSLYYFPPRNNSGWIEQTAKLSEVFPPDCGRWIIPQIPSDLGTKQ